ncbi:dehydrodolichyl diphosphate synthase 4-like [Silene latifolia]|uniref:dehydrodolichyl diphosphate synthase 4-like n=1 Tax=Silene latifolia TaxID=37657 RepID=UPI003D78985C
MMLSLVRCCANSVLSSSVSKNFYSKESGVQNIRNYVNFTSHKVISCSALTPAGDHEYAKVGLRRDLMPRHVAVILDGNRRWLKSHGKELDYRPFYKANMLVVDLCLKWGIPTVTSFIYGLRTLGRSKEANDLLFRQLQEWLQDMLEVFIRKRVRVRVIGERFWLPKSVQDTIKQVEEATTTNSTRELVLAVCYEGRNDIVKATKIICKKAMAGEIELEAIDESMIQRHLSSSASDTNPNPNPDLLIRTGGDLYLSNFMMWELAQTELYFTTIYGPEFNEAEFLEALRNFQRREKAFDK